MPTVKYPKNPNTDTAFVTDDNGHTTRAVKTVLLDGTVDYPKNSNSDSCYVTVDGKKQRALMTADISSEGSLSYPNNSNSTKGYVTVNGKKQRVILTAALSGGGSAPVIDELNVTPSTSAQVITAPEGTDGYSPVNVAAVTSSIDANITAGNIKKDVSILGVTGSYEGNIPTGTKYITSNGTHDVTNYATADVQVPTTAPTYYREFELTSGGELKSSTTTTYLINLSNVKTITTYAAFAYAYTGNSNISGLVDMHNLVTCNQNYVFQHAFENCVNITGVDLSSLKILNPYQGFEFAFANCSGITNVKLNNLFHITNNNTCKAMFKNCTAIPNIDMHNLIRVDGAYCCQEMFQGNTSLTSVNLSGLVYLQGSNSCMQSMFKDCSNLVSVDISRLSYIGVNAPLSGAFTNCTSLQELKFGGLAYNTRTNAKNAFTYMLNGVTGCTVHFPEDWETEMLTWPDVQDGFHGTNTTILFDLPSVTSVDLSNVTTIEEGYLFGDTYKDCPNITSVDLSNLVYINPINSSAPFSQTFRNCSNLTNVNMSSLKDVLYIMFYNAAFMGSGITSLSFPALKTVNGNPFNNMLQNVTGCTVHFPSNMSSHNFNCGGTNTTVLYDLPATNILTGANTTEYERNPKYDTATALAWRVKDTGTAPNLTIDWTPYYTSGTTDPAVSDTIYSDSACTTAVTTISNIA